MLDFLPLQGNFVVTRRQRYPKTSLVICVNDVTSPFLFSTTNVAFASGTEPGSINSDWPRLSRANRNYSFNS